MRNWPQLLLLGLLGGGSGVMIAQTLNYPTWQLGFLTGALVSLLIGYLGVAPRETLAALLVVIHRMFQASVELVQTHVTRFWTDAKRVFNLELRFASSVLSALIVSGLTVFLLYKVKGLFQIQPAWVPEFFNDMMTTLQFMLPLMVLVWVVTFWALFTFDRPIRSIKQGRQILYSTVQGMILAPIVILFALVLWLGLPYLMAILLTVVCLYVAFEVLKLIHSDKHLVSGVDCLLGFTFGYIQHSMLLGGIGAGVILVVHLRYSEAISDSLTKLSERFFSSPQATS